MTASYAKAREAGFEKASQTFCIVFSFVRIRRKTTWERCFPSRIRFSGPEGRRFGSGRRFVSFLLACAKQRYDEQ